MEARRPLVVTGQQIGAGWSPALSVVKALAALHLARELGGEAVYWMADEDHDRLEVASVVGERGGRLQRHRFRFPEPDGTATGWLSWTPAHQEQAEALWGPLPAPTEPTLRGHVKALGQPLWDRGLRPFSPTAPEVRDPIQGELERLHALDLEADLIHQANALEAAGEALVLDPRQQAAWFSLDPRTGLRTRLARGERAPSGHWLSPGAALRPLMQSILLPVTHAVLGPSERKYWRLCEPLWERAGLVAPILVPRPRVVLMPADLELPLDRLPDLQAGRWEAFVQSQALPSLGLEPPRMTPLWGEALSRRVMGEWRHFEARIRNLDRRFLRDQLGRQWRRDPERVRQALFPLGKDQERLLAGAPWLGDAALLDRILAAFGAGAPLVRVEAP